jgi:hypothetical protein
MGVSGSGASAHDPFLRVNIDVIAILTGSENLAKIPLCWPPPHSHPPWLVLPRSL